MISGSGSAPGGSWKYKAQGAVGSIQEGSQGVQGHHHDTATWSGLVVPVFYSAAAWWAGRGQQAVWQLAPHGP